MGRLQKQLERACSGTRRRQAGGPAPAAAGPAPLSGQIPPSLTATQTSCGREDDGRASKTAFCSSPLQAETQTPDFFGLNLQSFPCARLTSFCSAETNTFPGDLNQGLFCHYFDSEINASWTSASPVDDCRSVFNVGLHSLQACPAAAQLSRGSLLPATLAEVQDR